MKRQQWIMNLIDILTVVVTVVQYLDHKIVDFLNIISSGPSRGITANRLQLML